MTEPLDFTQAAPTDPSQSQGVRCGDCSRQITSAYFEAGGKTLCAVCKGRLAAAQGGSGSYARGLGLGLLASLAGAGIYFAVAAITGYEVGLIAILVGFLVGQGVKRGSRSVGGRKFQVTAAVLTYFAIAMSYSGIMAKEIIAAAKKGDARRAGLSAPAPGSPKLARTAAVDSAELAGQAPNPRLGAMAIPAGVGAVIAFVMLVPVLVIVGGLPASLLSLLIMGFGVMQAWKMNQRVEVAISGPFPVRAKPADLLPIEAPELNPRPQVDA